MNLSNLLDRCLDTGRDQSVAPPPIMLYVSGPSGSGKNSIITAALQRRPNLAVSISATTRQPRKKSNGFMELNGPDYYFMSRSDFEQDVSEGYFMEYAEVHGNLYGTPWDSIEHPWSLGKSIVGDVDVQGVMALVHHNDPRVRKNLLTVFVAPPSAEHMCARMKHRDDTITFGEMSRRVETATNEITHAYLFDHVIINNVFEEAVTDFLDVVDLLTAVMDPNKRRSIFKKLYWRRRQAIDFLNKDFDWSFYPRWAVQGPSAVVNP